VLPRERTRSLTANRRFAGPGSIIVLVFVALVVLSYIISLIFYFFI